MWWCLCGLNFKFLGGREVGLRGGLRGHVHFLCPFFGPLVFWVWAAPVSTVLRLGAWFLHQAWPITLAFICKSIFVNRPTESGEKGKKPRPFFQNSKKIGHDLVTTLTSWRIFRVLSFEHLWVFPHETLSHRSSRDSRLLTPKIAHFALDLGGPIGLTPLAKLVRTVVTNVVGFFCFFWYQSHSFGPIWLKFGRRVAWSEG